jgi:alpha-methylacyl-CoA racemase
MSVGSDDHPTGPLSGYRILDLTRLLPGGFATGLLADLGADIIKVERPGAGDRMRSEQPRVGVTSAHTWVTDRNKRSIAIDLKDSRGLAAFKLLVREADALIEGFRPGVTARLGISYADLRALNRRLVYCSISGYGQDGPLAAAAGHDINYIGRAGILSVTGPADGAPAIPGVQIADLAGGALMSLVGLLSGLLAASATGEGDHVDVSMTDGAFSLLSIHLGVFFASGEPPRREGMRLNGRFPCYNVYECADGEWITVGAIEEQFFSLLCETIGRPDLVGTRLDETAVPVWRDVFLSRTAADWLESLESTDACVGPVNDFARAVADRQLRHRRMVVTLDQVGGGSSLQVGTPIKLRRRSPAIRHPARQLGQDTRACLAEAGLSGAEIDALLEAGVVAIPEAG